MLYTQNKGVTAVDSEEEKAAVRDILFDMKVEDLSTDVLMSSAPPTKGPVVRYINENSQFECII